MSKSNLFLLVLLLSSVWQSASAQKEDYIWTLGYQPNLPNEGFGGTMLNFHNQDEFISYFPISLDLYPSSVISTPLGNLVAYSGGCSISNGSHVIMQGGEGINEGSVADIYCGGQGYPSGNGVMLLNTFRDSSNYFLIHIRVGDENNPNLLYTDLLFSRFLLDDENPLGTVVEKNITILQDSFSDHLTAVRHGNGRDWWIVVNKDRGNKIYVIHLSTDGIVDIKQQNIGPQWSAESYQGQSVFSPDGRLFARAAPFNNLTVLDFDRCGGVFSNPRWVPMPDDEAFASGVAFSPNSQYLYLTTGEELHQYDTGVQDLASSRILVDTFDGFMAPFSTTFYQMRLAPDDRIYMQSTSTAYVLHVINNPNGYGKACDFQQHKIELPSIVDVGAPNVPFYRLYDMADSPCDTLGINAPTVSATASTEETGPSIQIAPNPTSNHSILRFSEPYTGRIQVIDGLGRLVYDVQIDGQYEVELEAGDLPAGLYQVYCSGMKSGVLRWMVVR